MLPIRRKRKRRKLLRRKLTSRSKKNASVKSMFDHGINTKYHHQSTIQATVKATAKKKSSGSLNERHGPWRKVKYCKRLRCLRCLSINFVDHFQRNGTRSRERSAKQSSLRWWAKTLSNQVKLTIPITSMKKKKRMRSRCFSAAQRNSSAAINLQTHRQNQLVTFKKGLQFHPQQRSSISAHLLQSNQDRALPQLILKNPSRRVWNTFENKLTKVRNTNGRLSMNTETTADLG